MGDEAKKREWQGTTQHQGIIELPSCHHLKCMAGPLKAANGTRVNTRAILKPNGGSNAYCNSYRIRSLALTLIPKISPSYHDHDEDQKTRSSRRS